MLLKRYFGHDDAFLQDDATIGANSISAASIILDLRSPTLGTHARRHRALYYRQAHPAKRGVTMLAQPRPSYYALFIEGCHHSNGFYLSGAIFPRSDRAIEGACSCFQHTIVHPVGIFVDCVWSDGTGIQSKRAGYQ